MKNYKTWQVIILLFVGLVITTSSRAQENTDADKKINIGVEVQWYPAGWIIGPVVSHTLNSRHIINVRIAANIADRHDWGKNDNETGSGFGGSVGYRYLLSPKKNSLFIGARVDLWGMKIDWKNKINTAQATSGQTKITIFQPTAEAGYLVKTNKEKWSFVFSAAAGREINIKTNGRPVGEGGIFLLGVTAFYAL